MLFLNFYANLSLGVLVKFLKSEKNAPNISKIGIHPICIPILRAVLPFSEGSSRNLRLNFYIPKSENMGFFGLKGIIQITYTVCTWTQPVLFEPLTAWPMLHW